MYNDEIRLRCEPRVVERCQDLPAYEPFGYVDDDGEVRAVVRVESADPS